MNRIVQMKKYSIQHLKLIATILFINLIHFSAVSQTKHIEGNIIDTTENRGIKNAKVILVNLKDSTIVNHKTTDNNGNFILSDFSLELFRIIIEHPKYETREFYFLEETPEENYVLNGIVMAEKGKQIEEITIFAYADPVYYKGDTLVYVADSFKTRPNAVVEDLLKKLPGITVGSDGSIKSQGKNVSRVYVDGDEFFGSDATLATKNLAASSVETVQVYETTLDDAQASDEKIQVIDLKLKDEAKKGYFGKASFGTDFTRFYESQALVNKFNKKQKISAYFLTTNTTRSSLSWRDANQFGIQQGNAYEYNAETDSWSANENFISSDDGFPQVLRTGAFFNDQLTEKLKIGANYTYSDFRKQTEETSRTQFFLPDTTYSSFSKTTSNLHAKHHQANLNLEYKIDSTQTIVFEPKINYISRTDERNSSMDFLNSDNLTNRQSTNTTTGESDAFNLKTKLVYVKKFKKEKRQLRLLNNFIYDQSASNSHLGYADYFNQTGITENEIDQFKTGDRSIVSNLFGALYAEPINKKMRIEFYYELFNTTNTNNRRSFNGMSGVYTDLDSLTSGDFKTAKIQNKLTTTFVYDYKKHLLTIGVAGRNVLVDNSNKFIGTSIHQNVSDFQPKITYNYRIHKNSSLRFNSSTSSTLPSIGYLQPIYDNSNPNAIRSGNENLKPNYLFTNRLTYNVYSPLSGSYFYGGAYSNYVFNDFVSSITYDSLGRTISNYQNHNSLGYLGAYANAGIALIKQVLNLEPNASYNYGNRYNFVNNEKNTQIFHSLKTGLDIALYTDVVEFTFGASYEVRENQNSISSTANLTNTTYGLNSDLTVYLPWKMEITTDFEYNNYNNLSQDFNINTFIWNAEIQQKIGKNDNWIIAVQAFDLLNQNTRINRSAYANFITDNRTAIISRYFMLNLSYIFNSTFKKSKKNDEE